MIKRADGVYVDSPVHVFFGLTYSAYFVMPRLALEAMPLEWQERFVALMNEADDMGLVTPEYTVQRRGDDGRFIKDPWANYRRGRASDCHPSFAALAKAQEAAVDSKDRAQSAAQQT